MAGKNWKTRIYLAVFLAVISSANALKYVNVFIPGLGTCMGTREAAIGGNVDMYKGIPYAKPPVGPLRFQPPQNTTWSGVLNATKFGNICPQSDILTGVISGDEDCLTLNVYCPSNSTAKLAVMVWIHGGGVDGASSQYDARVLSRTQNVIVVTINFRLGVLGFFNVPGTETKGNYGLLDQITALRWVKKNIAAFGGDPNKVTIFGESYGGGSTSILSVSPLIKNEGLFIRSISQSGVASNPWACKEVTNDEQAKFFGTKTRCPMKGAALVECLRGISSKEIVQAQYRHQDLLYFLINPNVDKHVLHDLPSKLQAQGKLVPIVNEQMMGYTKDEGTIFAMLKGLSPINANKTSLENIIDAEMHLINPRNKKTFKAAAMFEYSKYTANNSGVHWYESSSEYISDLWFVKDTKDIAENFASLGNKVYFYEFTYLPKFLKNPMLKCAHFLEVEYLFGAPFVNTSLLLLDKFTDDDKVISQNVMKMWANFAKTGDPGMSWPLYTSKQKKFMEIDFNLTIKEMYLTKRMAFWKELVPRLDDVKICKKCKNSKRSSVGRSQMSYYLVGVVIVYVFKTLYES